MTTKGEAMPQTRATRNRTITLTAEEIAYYAARCRRGEDPQIGTFAGDQVIHGDAFESMRHLPHGFADLLVVDPPYNLSRQFGATKFAQQSKAEYQNFTRLWIEAAIPLLKPHASVYVCSDWRSSLVIGNVLDEYFHLQNRITWQREKGRGAKTNWKNSMEDIWFATTDKSKYTFNVDTVKMRRKVVAPYRVDGQPKDWIETSSGNFRDTYPSNFWDDISIPYWSMPENTDHPTQKPEKLFAKLVLASSNPGDIVFDPFLGVGTSAVVARKLGRKFVGIEREVEYCALAQKRLEIVETDCSIQGYVEGVFWERNTLAAQKQNLNTSAPLKRANTNLLEGILNV